VLKVTFSSRRKFWIKAKNMDNPRRALGKGLGALLSAKAEQSPATPSPSPTEVPIDAIQSNPLQPRRTFHQEALEELAQSIRTDGIIQPLIVRKHQDGYQLIAGERRWRAARIAGLDKVPVVVQDISDDRMLEIALIENIQREDLNPIEMAEAFDRMSRELNLTQEEIGRRTGKDRAVVANAIRLLQLPVEMKALIGERKLSPGHALAIMKLKVEEDRIRLARQTIEMGWSVRQVEQAASMLNERRPEQERPPAAQPAPVDPNVRAAIEEMERALGTRVRIIEARGGKGRLEIEYYSAEDLDRIYNAIAGTPT
jgi:ParB family chromosome partitioning protein